METLSRAVEFLWQGGWVMAPLIVCSVLMWALIGERLFFFHSLTRQDIQLRDAITMLEEKRSPAKTKGLRAGLVATFCRQMTGHPGLDKRILYHCALKQRPALGRHLAAIAVLASVAPLLGLLGTVIGMIDTFDVIAIFGTGNVKALASGVSVALITTESGLVVAIPGLLLGAYLYRQAYRLEMRLQEIASVLMRHV
jgi:biopolymer transport protein ExbB